MKKRFLIFTSILLLLGLISMIPMAFAGRPDNPGNSTFAPGWLKKGLVAPPPVVSAETTFTSPVLGQPDTYMFKYIHRSFGTNAPEGLSSILDMEYQSATGNDLEVVVSAAASTEDTWTTVARASIPGTSTGTSIFDAKNTTKVWTNTLHLHYFPNVLFTEDEIPFPWDGLVVLNPLGTNHPEYFVHFWDSNGSWFGVPTSFMKQGFNGAYPYYQVDFEMKTVFTDTVTGQTQTAYWHCYVSIYADTLGIPGGGAGDFLYEIF